MFALMIVSCFDTYSGLAFERLGFVPHSLVDFTPFCARIGAFYIDKSSRLWSVIGLYNDK